MNYYLGRRRSASPGSPGYRGRTGNPFREAQAARQRLRERERMRNRRPQQNIQKQAATAQQRLKDQYKVTQTQRPANENFRTPANENYTKEAIRNTARFLFRRNAYFRIAEIGYTVYLKYRHMFPWIEAFWMTGPWSIQQTCNPRGGFGLFQAVSASPPPNPTCLQSTGTGAFPPYPSPVSPAIRAINVLSRYEPTGTLRGDTAFRLQRATTGAVILPYWAPQPVPRPQPWRSPQEEKPYDPNPASRPLPWITLPERKPDPWTPPPPTDVQPDPPPRKDTIIEARPGWPGGRPRQLTRNAKRRPPRKNEKEKKFQGANKTIQKIFRRLSQGKEAASEMDDFIDTIFEALPKKRQRELKGRKTPQQKLKKIYEHWDEIDWQEWGKNYLENWLEDKVVGRALKAGDKAAIKRGETNTTSSRAWMRAGNVH